MEPIDYDLLAVLGSLRYRLEPRLNAAGIRLNWQVRELAPLPNLTPRNVLHILRVVQEALTNVLKHAGANLITVTTEADIAAGTASIRVADDGHGFVPEAVILESEDSLHVLNYNSPGATGAPAFSSHLVRRLESAGRLRIFHAKPRGHEMWDYDKTDL